MSGAIAGTLGGMHRLCTPAWLARHVCAASLVAGFGALGWWQITRAASGNTLSWAYAVEWPVFAGFVVFVWAREIRQTLRPAGTVPAASRQPATVTVTIRRPVRTRVEAVAILDDSDDTELADYNRYLAWLNANPGAKPGDYPG